jgi:biotin operon repressor
MKYKDKTAISPPESRIKKKPYFFSIAPTNLVKSKLVSNAAVRLYLLYHSHCPMKHIEKGFSRTFVSQSTLAEELGCDERTIQRRQKELEQAGWISVRPGKGLSSNTITLHSTSRNATIQERNKSVIKKLEGIKFQKFAVPTEVDATKISGEETTEESH